VFDHAISAIWNDYIENKEYIVPFLIPLTTIFGMLATLWVGVRVARAALRQAATSTRLADVAAQRHAEQTKADQERRITENFTKSVEQLGSDKLQVRLGGIFGLERIARESEDDYWPTMEIITAFIRESAPWREPENAFVSGKAAPVDADESVPIKGYKLPTDIEAALTVIKRRNAKMRTYEMGEKWILDFSGSDLRGADFHRAHLDGASFAGANLEGSCFAEAHLEFTKFMGAYLKSADFMSAQLTGASFAGADLSDTFFLDTNLQLAVLGSARLGGACFKEANLKGALFWSENDTSVKGVDFEKAHLEGVCLDKVEDLESSQIQKAFGDHKTTLPEGVVRPGHWPALALG
jgi:uncharacterized protein YjbI with pentapeptide repeats